MKKILLTLCFAMIANLGFSARTIDWSVVSINAPTELRSSSNGTTFNYHIVLKNNGAGTVKADDTMALQMVCFSGSTLIFAYPSSTQIVIKAVGKTMAPGDTIHWKGSLTAPVKANFSFNCSFQAYSEVRRFTGADPITPETSATNANNVKVNPIVFFNQQGWGVSVNSVYTNNMSVYPNPAISSFTIALNAIDTKADVQVSITDMNGRVVYSETKANASEFEINSANYAKGIYMVRVVNGDIISTSKVSIQ
jgi:hypothetical protein